MIGTSGHATTGTATYELAAQSCAFCYQRVSHSNQQQLPGKQRDEEWDRAPACILQQPQHLPCTCGHAMIGMATCHVLVYMSHAMC